ncbi:MAG: NAD(P)/FAD-dependent oxidoreductase, partial [Verrucomicrobiota bacterium]
MNQQFDVVIVGAGPAGLATAACLGRNSLKVAILDRRSLPIDKPCGEGVMPPGVAILEKLGAAPYLSDSDYHPFHGIQYLSPTGNVAKADFAEGPGLGIRRTNLSQALTALLAEQPSVELHENTKVKGIQQHQNGVTVQTEKGDLTARLLLGADGLHSRVRKWAGLEGKSARHRRLGIRRHFEVPPWSRYVDVHSGPGVEAYVTPCGPNQVGIACLWERKAYSDTKPGPDLLDSLLKEFPDIQSRLEGAKPVSETLTTGPLEQKTKRRVSDSVILIGDAAGYLDACTGEGITLALKQSLLLESHIVPLLKHSTGLVRADQLREYERACRKMMGSYYLGTHFLLLLNRQPKLMETFVRV